MRLGLSSGMPWIGRTGVVNALRRIDISMPTLGRSPMDLIVEIRILRMAIQCMVRSGSVRRTT